MFLIIGMCPYISFAVSVDVHQSVFSMFTLSVVYVNVHVSDYVCCVCKCACV